ncbi:hypothetical protein SBOR_9375 [Sclerotinia borealis F-4128]|uniref:Uncharacterized protein n=1 Tax=Sclerotinia borealis (strain F-4128) TaxID=1432307 RepID=W9C3D8_SCLBF|nr:hypothetical protein SBOR_9375 [Sclerotinia borealis F-4128]
MSFYDFLQVIGSALVVAICVLMMRSPIDFEVAPASQLIQVAPPSPVTQSLSEPQAAQLVASPSPRKMSRVEELIGSVQVTPTCPQRDRKPSPRIVFAPAQLERRSMIKSPSIQSIKADVHSSSVAGAQQIITTTSTVTTTMDIEMTDVASAYAEISEVISVEVEMVDAPAPQLKSCMKSSFASRSAKSVSFAGPSSDCIRGKIATHVVSEAFVYPSGWSPGALQSPHETFPIIEEKDQEGNPTGWFYKQDSIYYPPKIEGHALPLSFCRECHEHISHGFLNPIVDYTDAVLADIKGVRDFVILDQAMRYNCGDHGGF